MRRARGARGAIVRELVCGEKSSSRRAARSKRRATSRCSDTRWRLFKAVGSYPCTWDLFARWGASAAPKPARVQIFQRHCVVVADPDLVKRVMQVNLKNYKKDTEFSYEPFLEILGTGLVTSEGETWREQRQRISSALRVEILDDIIAIATRAVDRLSEKLERVRGKNEPVELAEEFRLLTLQVIAEAILSLTPEQSDEVMPNLYLPIMEECNRRSLEPWRKYLPTSEWFAHRTRVAMLNEYIVNLIRGRWKKRTSGEANENPDILDRVLASVEVEDYGADIEEQMCYEIKTFLLAGHETSAAMLIWTTWELVNNEEKMAKAVAEANKVLGKVNPVDFPRETSSHILITTFPRSRNRSGCTRSFQWSPDAPSLTTCWADAAFQRARRLSLACKACIIARIYGQTRYLSSLNAS